MKPTPQENISYQQFPKSLNTKRYILLFHAVFLRITLCRVFAIRPVSVRAKNTPKGIFQSYVNIYPACVLVDYFSKNIETPARLTRTASIIFPLFLFPYRLENDNIILQPWCQGVAPLNFNHDNTFRHLFGISSLASLFPYYLIGTKVIFSGFMQKRLMHMTFF